MRRRRFRPFRLGLLLGIVGAAAWFLQRQRSHEQPAPAPSPVVPPAPRPAAAPPAARAEPVLPVVAPDVLEVGDLDVAGEPEVETVDVAPAPPPPVKKKAPAKKAAAAKAAAPKHAAPEQAEPTSTAWIAPEGGTCPTSHPVKAKLKSKLFHLPGMFAYDRTNPDRCYVDEAAAEADGLRRAKR
jgi:hypothetical protein